MHQIVAGQKTQNFGSISGAARVAASAPTPPGQTHSLALMHDEKLYELCQHFGHRARLWRQKFAGLLPEVNRRRLYEKKGYGSIFEFAAKLAGMSREQVERVLGLARNFENIPVLKSLLENGAVSVHKLSRISSIATSENQNLLAAQVQLLSKGALETFVKDLRFAGATPQDRQLTEEGSSSSNQVVPGQENKQEMDFKFSQDAWKKQEIQGNSLDSACADITQLLQLKLTKSIVGKLLELQRKGIDANELFAEFLQKRKEEIEREKEKLARESVAAQSENSISRHIPAKIRRLLQKEHGTKCSVPSCVRDAETIHHTQRWALARMHDPHFLAPLCRNHHVIAHSIDVKFHKKRAVLGGGF